MYRGIKQIQRAFTLYGLRGTKWIPRNPQAKGDTKPSKPSLNT
jgi:hypothetical protein